MGEGDGEEGVEAVDEGGRERGEGAGEEVKMVFQSLSEGQGFRVGKDVDRVHDEVLGSPSAFFYCGFWLNCCGWVVEVECTD